MSMRVVITGATGTLGIAFARLCDLRGLPYQLLTRWEMDIASPSSVMRVLSELQPWAVINAAGYVRVDNAEHEFDLCHRENTRGAAVLAATCAQQGVKLLTFSSDLVFDGTRRIPYVESDIPAPLCVYGHTKAEAEKQVLTLCPSALVVRTSAFFGPWDEYNFVTISLRKLLDNLPVIAAIVIAVDTAAFHTGRVQAAESHYQLLENWAQFPPGVTKWGAATGVDVDAHDNVYVFHRN